MRARTDLEEVRKSISLRGAARRFTRVRAALACNEATIVLRHYSALREDAEYLRAHHPAHPASEMFASRAEGLAGLVEEKKHELEAERDARKAVQLSGIRQAVRDVKRTNEREEKIWKQAKDEADAVTEKFKRREEDDE